MPPGWVLAAFLHHVHGHRFEKCLHRWEVTENQSKRCMLCYKTATQLYQKHRRRVCCCKQTPNIQLNWVSCYSKHASRCQFNGCPSGTASFCDVSIVHVDMMMMMKIRLMGQPYYGSCTTTSLYLFQLMHPRDMLNVVVSTSDQAVAAGYEKYV